MNSTDKPTQKKRPLLAMALSFLVPFLLVFTAIFVLYLNDAIEGVEREERQFGRFETTDQQIVLYASREALPLAGMAGIAGFVVMGVILLAQSQTASRDP